MLQLKVVAAGRAAALVARAAKRLPAGLRILRRVPLPGKRAVVAALSPTGLPSLERARVGRVLYDLDLRDQLQRAIYFGSYERAELRRALRLTPEGGVCIDAGSCVGYYAMNLARKVGSSGVVHAFEPDPRNHERLVRNCVLNGLDGRVITNRIALSNAGGPALLHIRPGQSGAATLAGFGDGRAGAEPVRTDTIDDYVERYAIRRVDFAKIDVGGHELEVLEGACRTLKGRSIHRLLIEIDGAALGSQGRGLPEVISALDGYGYVPVARHRWRLALLRRSRDPARASCILLFRPARD